MIKTNKYFYYKYKKKANKLIIFLFIALFFIAINIFSGSVSNFSYADDDSTDSITEQLTDSVNEQLDALNLTELEALVDELTSTQSSIFGEGSFLSKLSKILLQEYDADMGSVFQQVMGLIFDELLAFLPLLATICAIAILSSFIGNLRGKSNESSIGDIIHFVCYGVIIVLICAYVANLIALTTDTLNLLKLQMDAIFPILLTLLTSVGGIVSVSVYQPAVAILTNGITQVFTYVVFPLFLFSFIFSIVGNLSSTIKLNKFISFFNSSFKWITGTIMTLFFTYLTFQGITAGSYDGISAKTAKYAIKSYVPIVGSYLSDGFNLIISSSILIKNAIGVTGLILLVATIVLPVIKIIVFSLGLKLVSAIIEPVVDPRISNFIYSVAKSLNFLIAIILCIAFMYVVCIGLIICTGNMFYT